jgi:hypothetical protein
MPKRGLGKNRLAHQIGYRSTEGNLAWKFSHDAKTGIGGVRA